MTPPTTIRSRSSRLVAGLAVVAAAILGVSVLVILWALGTASSDMDRAQNAGQTQLVGAILKTNQDGIVSAVADYTSWDQLYNYLKGPRDLKWETGVLGPYLQETFGTDAVFIVSRSGRLAYSYNVHEPAAARDAPLASPMLRRLAEAAFAAKDQRKGISGIISLGGMPAMMAAGPIVPTSEAGPAQTKPAQFVLIEAQELDRKTIDALGRKYGILDLKIDRSQGPGIQLMDPQRRPSGFRLSWVATADGRLLFKQVLPVILLIGLIAGLAFAGVGVTWWRFLDHLKEGESRVLAAELEATRAEARAAEETSKSKSAFIANMSHELRTPLNAILGFSEVLQAGTFGPMPSGKYREYIDDIHTSGKHLLRLVNDILQLSKIEADKMETEIGIVSAHDAIDDTMRVVKILAAKRNVRIQIHRDSTSPQVVADKNALEQILLNLLSNAVKFSEDGGLVEIRCAHAGSHCVIRVSDRGCGIPAETLAQLGKPFVQAEGAFARKYQGTGLGLAISFRLAQMIGASLEIDSIEGDGTTASLTLQQASLDANVAA
ncbi:MAG TPA: ATP-binding protein [Rhizomicrobium sp.]|jgi:signal transduction histidine kinase|nr:ATP-binding protein [Rhizomicrobium sp.]